MIGPSNALSLAASVAVSAAAVVVSAVVAAPVAAVVAALLDFPEQPASPITAMPSANKTAADFFITFYSPFLYPNLTDHLCCFTCFP